MAKKSIQTDEASLRREIAKAKIDLAAGKLKNTRAVFNLRHQLAKVLSHANDNR